MNSGCFILPNGTFETSSKRSSHTCLSANRITGRKDALLDGQNLEMKTLLFFTPWPLSDSDIIQLPLWPEMTDHLLQIIMRRQAMLRQSFKDRLGTTIPIDPMFDFSEYLRILMDCIATLYLSHMKKLIRLLLRCQPIMPDLKVLTDYF